MEKDFITLTVSMDLEQKKFEQSQRILSEISLSGGEVSRSRRTRNEIHTSGKNVESIVILQILSAYLKNIGRRDGKMNSNIYHVVTLIW